MADWPEVARAAAAAAGSPSPDPLGEFLPLLARACATGARTVTADLAAFRTLGARAAGDGVHLRALIDLYLSATRLAWPHLVPAADGGEVALRALQDALAAVVDGFQDAFQDAVRIDESARREFVDDLLTGTGDPAGMAARAERFGLDLTRPHRVAVVRGDARTRVVPGADVLLTTRDDLTVAVLPLAVPETALGLSAPERAGLGRVHSGAPGIARSYGEARAALDLADRLGLDGPVARAEHLLAYQVLLRDRDAITDLVEAVLAPLRSARGGAGPLLDTIDAYLGNSGNASAAARRLSLSVRAVTYRLQRIQSLTGRDPADPEDRFVLQAALLGARALGWQ